jgi:CBS domain-containing protein
VTASEPGLKSRRNAGNIPLTRGPVKLDPQQISGNPENPSAHLHQKGSGMDDRDRAAEPGPWRGQKAAESAYWSGGTHVVTVRDLIDDTAVIVTPETSMANAAAIMVRARAGSAIVIQASFLAGILTKWDVLRATSSGEDPSKSPVSVWMTPDPQSVPQDTPAEAATQIMLQNGIRHLPVVQGNDVRGVIRLRDLLAVRIRRSAPPAQPNDAAATDAD